MENTLKSVFLIEILKYFRPGIFTETVFSPVLWRIFFIRQTLQIHGLYGFLSVLPDIYAVKL